MAGSDYGKGVVEGPAPTVSVVETDAADQIFPAGPKNFLGMGRTLIVVKGKSD